MREIKRINEQVLAKHTTQVVRDNVKDSTKSVANQRILESRAPVKKEAQVDDLLATRTREQLVRAEKHIDEVLEKHIEKPAPSLEERRAMAQEMYNELEKNQLAIRFDVPDPVKRGLIVKVIYKQTGEVKWQYPTEKSEAMKELAEFFPGMLLNKKG